MIFNIVENAIVHGGTREPLQVRLSCTETECLLEIADLGPGIARADQPHIFERFYRADKPSERRGSGLGLYIAKGFVEAFRGSISVKSPTIGRIGTTMRIRLPLAQPAMKAEAIS